MARNLCAVSNDKIREYRVFQGLTQRICRYLGQKKKKKNNDKKKTSVSDSEWEMQSTDKMTLQILSTL